MYWTTIQESIHELYSRQPKAQYMYISLQCKSERTNHVQGSALFRQPKALCIRHDGTWGRWTSYMHSLPLAIQSIFVFIPSPLPTPSFWTLRWRSQQNEIDWFWLLSATQPLLVFLVVGIFKATFLKQETENITENIERIFRVWQSLGRFKYLFSPRYNPSNLAGPWDQSVWIANVWWLWHCAGTAGDYDIVLEQLVIRTLCYNSWWLWHCVREQLVIMTLCWNSWWLWHCARTAGG